MQRSYWAILTTMCVCLLPIYLFASPQLLRLLNQDKKTSMLAGKFSLYMISRLFAYGFNFLIQSSCRPEQDHDHGHSLSCGHGVPYILKLASDGSLQVGSRGCSCLTQLGLVDCGAWVVCLYCYGMLHWCLDWLQLGGFQGLGTLCQALYRFSYHDMVLDLDSLWSYD